MSELKQTPLYPLYKEFGAKTVEFGGWDMPVQFTSILQEHEAVRTKAGLFDVSHMGEFDVQGPDAKAYLQQMVTNDVNRLSPGRAIYSPLCYEDGGTVDDLLVYCLEEDHYMIVVNAGNIEKDFDWFSTHVGSFNLTLRNVSDDFALLAVQGPLAQSILQPHVDGSLEDIRFFRFARLSVAGVSAIVSRTGYTGEDGFELYLAATQAPDVWRALLSSDELVPCGLGARDTLRLEAKLPLYGHELSPEISPLQAGLAFAVKLQKGDFIGRDALITQSEEGMTKKIVGIQVQDRGIPRSHYNVIADGAVIGEVTSGTMSPTLRLPIALALLDSAYCDIGTDVYVEIRGRQVPAKVVETPFYKRS